MLKDHSAFPADTDTDTLLEFVVKKDYVVAVQQSYLLQLHYLFLWLI